MADIDFLPVRKKNSTPVEWCQELECIARKFPERFERAVLICQATAADGGFETRYTSRNVDTNQIFGLIELGVYEIHKTTRTE